MVGCGVSTLQSFLLYFVTNMVGVVFVFVFVFLLYFVINMVGVVGVGSVVMSVAVSVCGRFSPSHTP